MAKTSGLGDGALIHGYDASCDICMLQEIGGGPSLWDVTTICKSAMARQGLQRSGRISFSFFMERTSVDPDPPPFGIHDKLSVLPYADQIVTYLRSQIQGQPAANLLSKQVNYDWRREQNGALTGSCQALSNGYSLEWGKQLTAGIVTHADGVEEDSIDNGAASAFAAAAYWHVSSVATGTVEGEIQDSADDVSFAVVDDLVFTPVADVDAPTAERVASTDYLADIRRYTRFVSSGTFTDAVLEVSLVRYETVTPN